MKIGATKPPSTLHRSLLENLGQNVTVARGASGLTQAALAEKAGLGRSSIGKIESFNTDDVSLSTVSAIAEALNLPPYLLLLGKDDWGKLVTISSIREMVEEGMTRLTAKSGGEEAPPPDIDRLARLSRSERPTDMAEAVAEIGTITSKILGQEADDRAKVASGSVPTALGASMLPGMPILNGIIARILSDKKKRF